jgi:lysozyme family protein
MKIIQQLLNNCSYEFKLDSLMNAEMVAALNKIDAPDFLRSTKKERIDFYNHLADHNPSQQKFLCHWLKRANILG